MTYKLQDLIDLAQFQNLQDRLNEIYSFPSAIIDNAGNVLTATAWQDVCTKFHRKNKDSQQLCIQSDQFILSHLHEANPAVSYRCPHGLVDNAMPIIIDGVHYGNFFTGQFFLEAPDPAFFRAQAEKYGFDPEAYLEAVKKVPVWTQKQLNDYLFFIGGLIAVISESGLKNLKEIETRKQIEESEERYRLLFEKANEGILIAQSDRIQFANPALLAILGYPEDVVTGRPFVSFIHSADRDMVVDRHLRRMNGEPLPTNYHFRVIAADGTEKWVQISSSIVSWRGAPASLSFVTDVTEQLALEKRLNQAQRMEAIGALAGGVAHDFNNILFPIIGMTEMLMEDLPPGDMAHENAEEILKAARRASALVKQILAFSRQADPLKMPIRIQPVLQEAVRLSRATIPKDIDICQHIEKGCGPVMADATQVHQIAMNLITNAFHAVEETGGGITIRLEETQAPANGMAHNPLETGPYAALTVSDTGHGITPSIMNRIFEPYFTTKTQGKGTGLGLSVVYGIVKDHGGDIHVHSEPGKGAAFTVYLPLLKKSVEAEGSEKAPLCETGTERLLIVDDEAPIVRLETIMLQRLGYKVSAHTGSVEALAAFRADPGAYDLVLTDMTMPHMTGVRLAEGLISIRPDIPIIICTGFSEKINAEKATTAGIKGFLMKPVVKSDMAKMVRKVLDESKKHTV